MKRHSTPFIALALVLSAMPFASGIPQAHACSCMMPGSPAEAFADTDAVFSGTVTRSIDDEEAYRTEVQFKVSTQWKGIDLSESSTVTVHTGLNSAACGVEFMKGEEYLVYAYQDEETGELGASLCSRTTALENADEDLEYLKATEREEPTPSPAYTDIAPGTPYAEAILRLTEDGVFQGYADGSFRPRATVNRAEFVKILTASLYAPEDIKGCPGFADFAWALTDVRPDDWFDSFVCKARLEGLVSGYPDRTFRPSSSINFAEAAKITAAAYGVDVRAGGDVWYRAAVDALSAKHAIPPSIRGVDQKITRGEMAEMIYRLRYNITDSQSASL